MKIPIGVDDFKRLREERYSYVDKSLFIEEVCENSVNVQLITRPRRFGKTLNMSMLAYFYDHGVDNSYLFEGLAIEDRPCFEQCGSHPVVSLSFKDLKANNYELFLGYYRTMIEKLYARHGYLLPHLDDSQARFFKILRDGLEADETLLRGAITRLMGLLMQHTGAQVVLLIDEYDSPIEEAYRLGFYNEMIAFMRGALGEALKGNPALHKGVLTGILRISKESIFSDLNNLRVYTVLDPMFGSSFGFSEAEVKGLLEQADRVDQLDAVRNWYNGYHIGNAIVYNPWSMISFVEDPLNECGPYWVNTSDNSLVHQLLLEADPGTQKIIMDLINGGHVETPIYSQTTLRNLDASALWSLLLYSGYLTVASSKRVGDERLYDLKIPNTEVRFLYKNVFKRFMGREMVRPDLMRMLDALIAGDIPVFTGYFQKLITGMFSYYDTAGETPERVYHAFVLGLLANLDHHYHVRSNRESGYGRYDLMMVPKDRAQRGVILEFKIADRVEALADEAQAALAQIENKHYSAELEVQGVTAYTKVGIAFAGKQVAVVGRG